MSREVFIRALDFAWEIEAAARMITGYNLVLLSGGECTEHPQILEFIQLAQRRGFLVMLITNGSWLDKPELCAQLLASPVVSFQVTNDPRFYPKPIKNRLVDPRICYVDSLTHLIYAGRATGVAPHPELPEKGAPASFNLRSLTRGTGDVRAALLHLRQRALTGAGGGHCSPSISADGSFVAGEMNLCWQIGTVYSTPAEITQNILAMGSCDRCRLERKLTGKHRAALGLE